MAPEFPLLNEPPHTPLFATMIQALRDHAQRTPERVALQFLSEAHPDGFAVTYQELDIRARAIAVEILQTAQAGDRAILLFTSGLDYVAAFFGCLYAGVIAVPAYPPESARRHHLERLLSIMTDASPRLILTSTELQSSLSEISHAFPGATTPIHCADQFDPAVAEQWREPLLQANDIAFLQYTSGSTSMPKGVQVSHGNLVANGELIRQGFGMMPDDVMVSWLPLYHDMGLIGCLLQSVYTGFKCVLMSPPYFLERPVRWLEAISRFGGTISGGPDFAYRLCVERVKESALAGLRLDQWQVAFSGSEPIRADSLDNFAQKFALCGFKPHQFFACYGLAEGTLFVTGGQRQHGVLRLEVDEKALAENQVSSSSAAGKWMIGSGRQQTGHPVLIVDPHTTEALPEGDVGEIWAAGPSIALGYWNNPTTTANAFVARAGHTWLRTGDLGAFVDGELYVTGRLKDMVIVRGQNIYPQDIERLVETSVPEVRKGRVAAFLVQDNGEESIGIAAEVGRSVQKSVAASDLINRIRLAVIGVYQESPALVVLLNPGGLPKTSSGKLQRSACRARLLSGELDAYAVYPGSTSAETTVTSPALASNLAQQIRTVWCEQLQHEQLADSDHFFLCGGNSVSATQTIARLREQLQLPLQLRQLFDTPVLADFIAAITAIQATGVENSERIRPLSRHGWLVQSPAQQRLWLMWQRQPQSAAYNIPGGLRLRGELDISALQTSLAALVARHESLRTRFGEQQGQAVQWVDAEVNIPLQEIDITHLSDDERQTQAEAVREQEALTPFDLHQGPLLRLKLVKLDEQEHWLLLTFHHIVADGWSFSVLLRELAALYSAAISGQSPTLTALPVQYTDFSQWHQEWLNSSAAREQQEYWLARLADTPELLALPNDGPASANGGRAARYKVQVPEVLVKALKSHAQTRESTLFMLLLAGFQGLLYRHSGQARFCVGVPGAGRQAPEVQELVGFFINTLAFTADITPETTFNRLFGDVRAQVLAAQANQDIPFDRVLESLPVAQGRGEAASSHVVFNVMFNHQQRDLKALRQLPGLLAEEMGWHSREAKFPLQLQSEEDERGRLTLAFDYALDSYKPATIQRMAKQFIRLLEAICVTPSIEIADINLLDSGELAALQQWSKSAPVSAPAGLLPHHLSRQAALTPENIALRWHSDDGQMQQLDYRALDQASNQLAHYLQKQGVGPDQRVGILLERSPELLVSLLAVIKAGGTYVPLDVDYPAARRAFMLADSGARWLLSRTVLADDTVRGAVTLVDVERTDVASYPITLPSVELDPQHLAYVIYTSGTTGQPKGVGVTHAAMMDRLQWMHSEYPLAADEVFLQKAPISFDVSVWECFLPFIHGCTLVLAAPGEHRDPTRLAALVQQHHVTRLHFVPSLLQVFVDEPAAAACTSLRYLFAGGEALSPALRARVFACLPNVALYNRYGPTETTINITQWRCQPTDDGWVSMGRPVGDSYCHVLDMELQPAPLGLPGELYLGGIGLARGYLDRPGLTAERFIPDPFATGERLYRSGDKVRWRASESPTEAGALEFLGRIDQQVKVRGFRIELEEITAVIQKLPGVNQAVVVVAETAVGNQLVAYYTGPADATAVVESLGEQLPVYMVPACVMPVARMPLSPSGKLDKRALPEPIWQQSNYRAPRTPVEQQLAILWQEILGLERVGLDDNFFTLGGHSLLATRIVARTRQECDVELPLAALFDADNLEDFARRIEAAQRAGQINRQPPIVPADRSQPVPLSYSQQRMWFQWQLDPDSPAYNVGGMARLTGSFDLTSMERAYQALVARHETLRTCFPNRDGVPYQLVDDSFVPPILHHDFSMLDTPVQQQRLRELAEQEAHQAFDLEQGPLLRFCVVRMADDEHFIVLTLHHIVIEGWAMDIFARELGELYEAFCKGQPSPLAPLAVQYLDYTLWQRQWMEAGEQQRQLDYWVARLGHEHPVLTLPSDRPRPAIQSYRGGLYRFDLDDELASRLRDFNNTRGLTLFMTAVASLAVLLYRYSGQTDLRIGAPVANRIRPESEGLIGAFLNTQVVRCELDGVMSVEQILQQVRSRVIEAQSHQDLPFDQLVEALRPPRSAAWNPLFQVMCNVQRWEFQQTRRLGAMTVEYIVNDPEATKFDLNLEITDLNNRLGCCLTFSRDLFDEPRIVRMAEHWRALLAAMVAEPMTRVGELPLCDLAEQQVLQAPTGIMTGQRIHELFTRQAKRQPDATALVFGGKILSYRQLNEQANQLAHLLRARGIGLEQRVGLAFERSLEMVVGLLAILKAGGAYVPMDPEYPRERLRYLIDDSQVSLVLGHKALFDNLGELPASVSCWCYEDEAAALADYPLTEPTDLILPQHPAYMIYTSGSTGQPKGVVVAHSEIASHCQAVIQAFGITPADRELHFYSISFDAATERLLTPLLAGASLVIRAQGRWEADYIFNLIQAHDVSILGFTPGYGTQIARIASEQQLVLPVRLCITGGEALTSEQVIAIRTAFTPHDFFNAYGPTETVVMPLAHRVADELEEKATAIPIGGIIGDRHAVILDTSLALVPQGAEGELYVGGASLARGYHQRPGLTAERFVPDPFAAQGGRLYRTGDLVRLRADQQVDYVGRVDYQVKIRGFRIELGEIEMQLRQWRDVQDAGVVVIEAASGKQLVAYLASPVYAGDENGRETWLEQLKQHLRAQLPDYMVPAHYVLLERLPLTPNGKLDRKALPVPELNQTSYVAPRSAVEERLAGLWEKVLNHRPVGINDNFFELGGDSILSIQLVSLARRDGLHFTPRNLLQYQTIGQLASVVTTSQQRQISQQLVTGELALTPIQQWFFASQSALATSQLNHWNQSVLLQPQVPLELEKLVSTLHKLVNHHDALRLRFSRTADHWQAVHGDPATNDVVVEQITVATAAGAEPYYANTQTSLNIEQGPLIRALLVEITATGEQRLLLVAHHLVVDGVSWRILLEDMQQIYTALANAETLALPLKTHAFRDWGRYLAIAAHHDTLRDSQRWWVAQLCDERLKPIPVDRPTGHNLAAYATRFTTHLDAEHTRQLVQEAGKAYRTRIDELLLAALAPVLCHWANSQSVLVQLEGHGREQVFGPDDSLGELDLTRTVGWFTSAYPVLLAPEGDVGANLKAIKEQVRNVPHKGLGYGLLRHAGQEADALAFADLPHAGIGFNYLGQVEQGGANSLFRLLDEPSGARHHPDSHLPTGINLDCQIFAGELVLTWTYSSERYDSSTIRNLAQSYQAMLNEIIAHCIAPEAGGLTPSDFPLARLTQTQIDILDVPAQAIEDIYPLTPMQEGMLLHSLLDTGNGIYFMQDRYQINNPLDRAHFALAWQQVIARHEALRASFCWDAGANMVQIIHKSGPINVDFLDWSQDFSELDNAARDTSYETRLHALLKTEREAGFDLLHAPPFHLRLIKLGEARYWFMMSNHHILIDAWCRSLLMNDFFEIYTALEAGRSSRLSVPTHYRDYIQWLQNQDPAEARRWWQDNLRGLTRATPIPSDNPFIRDHAAGNGGMQVADCFAQLTAEESVQLRELAQAHQLTVNTFAQAAWALTLRRLSGERDLLFGVTVAGRPVDRPDMQQIVGLFINSIPLRVRLPEPGARTQVRSWLQGLFASNMDLREHEYLSLVDIQSCSDIPKGMPLFDSLFVFENAPVEIAVLDRAREFNASSDSGRTHTNFPLTVVCYPGDILRLHISYDQRYFEVSTAEHLLAEFKRLLLALIEGFHNDVDALPLLADAEHDYLVTRCNQSERDYPLEESYARLFENRVNQHPHRIAASQLEREWSYGELNQHANRVAHKLLALGVQPDQPVALLAERSLELLAMMIGSFKAGAGYLPLDPAHPAQRLRGIIGLSHAPVLVADRACLDQARLLVNDCPGLQLLLWDDLQSSDESIQNPGIYSRPDNLAYVIFTSGSTGQPKGVMVEQRGMLNNQLSKVPYLELGESDVIAQTASQSFDISVWQFLTAPLFGGRVDIVPNAIAHDPGALLNHLAARQISVVESVPAIIQGMLEHHETIAIPALRWLLPTGEVMPPALAVQWRERYPAIAMVNAYGPAECSDDVAFYTVAADWVAGAYLPIGTPTDNNRLYLFDQDFALVPAGTTGEIHVAGVGVGRGYVGDAAQTAQRFIPDPFSKRGERLYRTGDLGRRLENGLLECIGRVDQQVKIRGYRIELGEIEAQLQQQPEVREAAVAVQSGPAGNYLVCFWASADPAQDDAKTLVTHLQERLRARLPDYMVPLHWQLLAQLPRNANGKLDRKALPLIDIGEIAGEAYLAPRSPLEQTLADIWSEVLKVEQVGVRDNFFALGGHSLLAAQIAARMQQRLQRNLPLRAMFECTTVEELAAYVDALQNTELTEEKVARLDDLMAELELL